MTSQSSTEALANRLILSCIFQHLAIEYEYKTLVECLCVSKIWENEARRALFYQLGDVKEQWLPAVHLGQIFRPTLSDLLNMTTSLERRQLYARCVRYIRTDATVPDRRGCLPDIDKDKKRLLAVLDLSLVQEFCSHHHEIWLSSEFFPVSKCGNLSKLEISSVVITPWIFEAISDNCPRIKDLKFGSPVPREIASLVENLRLLQTLKITSFVNEQGASALFDTVARHNTLKSVKGLPVRSSWIHDLRSSQEDIPWFTSLVHVGLSRPIVGDLEDPHQRDYAESVRLVVEIMPNLVSLQVQTYTRRVLETLVTLHKIQELKIVSPHDDEPPYRLTAIATLEVLLQMKNLRILRLPEFHRCRKDVIPPDRVTVNISWKSVEEFTRRMPNLEMLSFHRMRLHGITPSYAPMSFDYSPVTWKRNYGWEILDWEHASKPFKDAMSDVGKFMPHNYFGPYHAGVDSIVESYDRDHYFERYSESDPDE